MTLSVALLQESLDYLAAGEAHEHAHACLHDPWNWKLLDGTPHMHNCPVALQRCGETRPETLLLETVWSELCDRCPDPLDAALGRPEANVLRLAGALVWAQSLPPEGVLLRQIQELQGSLERLGTDSASVFRAEKILEAHTCLTELHLRVQADPLRHFQENAALLVAGSSLEEDDTASAGQLYSLLEQYWIQTKIDPRATWETQYAALDSSGRMQLEQIRQGNAFFQKEIWTALENHYQELLGSTQPYLVALPEWAGTILPAGPYEVLPRLGTLEGGWWFMHIPAASHFYLQMVTGNIHVLGCSEETDTPAILETVKALFLDGARTTLVEDGTLLQAARLLNP